MQTGIPEYIGAPLPGLAVTECVLFGEGGTAVDCIAVQIANCPC